MQGLAGLFEKGWVEWMTSMTYQAASGAGPWSKEHEGACPSDGETWSCRISARLMLVRPREQRWQVDPALKNDRANILDLDRAITGIYQEDSFPKENFGAPLAGALIPWIDKVHMTEQIDVWCHGERSDQGRGLVVIVCVVSTYARVQWKGIAETNKILGTSQTVRLARQINELRPCADPNRRAVCSYCCHALSQPGDELVPPREGELLLPQAITIKLKQDVPMDQIEVKLVAGHLQTHADVEFAGCDRVRVVPNTKESTLSELSPAVVKYAVWQSRWSAN
eukprot:758914-Hanusia_phi.AAC.6